jgi:hypothetical protein
MPGLVPGIHVLSAARKAWMAGLDVSPGHDGVGDQRASMDGA